MDLRFKPRQLGATVCMLNHPIMCVDKEEKEGEEVEEEEREGRGRRNKPILCQQPIMCPGVKS